MRKVLCLLVLFCILLPCIIITGSANESSTEVVYLDDGGYLTIYVSAIDTRSSTVKNGSKTYQYTNSNGEVSWKAVLNGTFTYTGSSATCTASSCTVTVYDSAWYQVSKTTGKSGGTATAELTMGYKFLGVTTKKVPVSMTLTCDANGNLS